MWCLYLCPAVRTAALASSLYHIYTPQHSTASQGYVCRSPTFVTCSKLASGRAVLLGDAAHAVSANVAVGCASALQDSQILSRACIAADGDVTAAAQRFDEDRLADAQTLTKASKGLDAVMNYKFHGGLLAVAAGLPYYVARKVTWMSPTAPLAGMGDGAGACIWNTAPPCI